MTLHVLRPFRVSATDVFGRKFTAETQRRNCFRQTPGRGTLPGTIEHFGRIMPGLCMDRADASSTVASSKQHLKRSLTDQVGARPAPKSLAAIRRRPSCSDRQAD